MAQPVNIQKVLFNIIKNNLPPHLSLVDEIAEVLGLSPDSSYRRIRGDKPLSLFEAEKLAKYYNLSIDNLLGIVSDSVTFQSSYLDENEFDFRKYLESLLEDMVKVSENPDIEVIFQLNELNLYHVIQFPELLAFKIYFWSKSSLDFESFREIKFSLNSLDEKVLELCHPIIDNYVKLNTTELLTQEFLISLLKQIEFYYDSGFFENKDDAEKLCRKALKLIEHLRIQAEVGYKFKYGIKPPGFGGKFMLYSNDLTLVDNVMLVGPEEIGMTYLTNGAINLLITTDKDFYRKNLLMARNIMKRSTLISDNAERVRNQFFNHIRDNVNELMVRLSHKKRH